MLNPKHFCEKNIHLIILPEVEIEVEVEISRFKVEVEIAIFENRNRFSLIENRGIAIPKFFKNRTILRIGIGIGPISNLL